MDTNLAFQVVLNGLVMGATYILIALGLAVVFSIGGVFNIAHGEFCMLGGFFFYYLFGKLGIPFILALCISGFGVAVIGIIIEKTLIHRILDHFDAVLIIMMGTLLILSGGAMVIFGEQDKAIQSPFSGVRFFWGLYLSNEKLAVLIISAALGLGLYLFFTRIKAGRALRAIGQDIEASAIVGIDTARYSTLSFGIAGFLAGIAGALLGLLFLVSPFVGIPYLLKGIIVIILGGLGSLAGAVVGGLFLGVLESITLTVIGTGAELVSFSILILVILFRPTGLFGHE
jgi:branched-chain amino acid transport system permease protein